MAYRICKVGNFDILRRATMDLAKMSINEVKELITKEEEISVEILAALAEDPRTGVKKLYEAIQRHKQAIATEKQRLEELAKYERELWAKGYSLIAGVDEAGRGPLAGPVVAAAVILKPGTVIEGLNDSKKLSSAQRGELETIIREKAVSFAVGIVNEKEIDDINIYQASLKAMYKAITNLKELPDYLLVDAVKVPGLSVPQLSIIHGDALSCSIAAASILAKETRDRIMLEYDRLFPQYGFAQNKGYGTPQHIEALRDFGPCPIHRQSFGKVTQ